MNGRSGNAIASNVVLAVTRSERRRGLLGRDHLETSAALVLSPCWAIHTSFMRFPIDVVFVDRDGCAVRIVRDLPAWRIAFALRAHAVIELPAGSLRTRDVRLGDTLHVLPGDPAELSLPAGARPQAWSAPDSDKARSAAAN